MAIPRKKSYFTRNQFARFTDKIAVPVPILNVVSPSFPSSTAKATLSFFTSTFTQSCVVLTSSGWAFRHRVTMLAVLMPSLISAMVVSSLPPKKSMPSVRFSSTSHSNLLNNFSSNKERMLFLRCSKGERGLYNCVATFYWVVKRKDLELHLRILTG